ncbi:MAG: hypothetical protein OEW41_08850, partial [Actinomycetota bacterium]|nr:hypothetical protein [Actinomycetota bacterium]
LAQRVWPKPMGNRIRAQQSSSKGQSLNPQQGVAVASRKGGGVFVAYKVGYPTANKIRVWKVGTKQGFTVRTTDADHISLLPGPAGRLWLVWDSNGGSVIKVSRTNGKATRLGVVQSLKPPKKGGSYNPVWATGGSGAGGPLHLLVNAQIGATSPQIWYQKVLAGLKLTASPKKLDFGKVVAKVSDAGKALSGAKVTFRGSTKTTGAKGTATFTVARGVKSGKYPMIATKAGYARGRAVVTVT